MDGTVIKQITEVSSLKIDQEMIELKHNTAGDKFVIKKQSYAAAEADILRL